MRPADQDLGDPVPMRVEAHEVVRRLRSGEGLLLVCAYDSPTAWRKLGLAGAVPLRLLEERLDQVEAGTEVVLYCRCPDEGTAVRQARRLLARGVQPVRVLVGGYRAAVAAGLRPLRSG